MERERKIGPCAAIIAVCCLFAATQWPGLAYGGPKVPRMAKEELRPLLGNPDVVIIDVRQPHDWDQSKLKIPGAVRVDPSEKIATVLARFPKDKTLIFYCS